jgi:hypothetical protein
MTTLQPLLAGHRKLPLVADVTRGALTTGVEALAIAPAVAAQTNMATAATSARAIPLCRAGRIYPPLSQCQDR